MPFSYIDFMTELQGGRYYARQPDFEPPSLTPLRKPIAESIIGVFTSCGARLQTDPALDETNDLSFRLLPRDVAVSELMFDHMTPVRVWAQEDLNVAYPRDRLVELEAEGTIGGLAPNAVSMVGSITRYSELIRDVVPKIKQIYDAARVDLVLLFPF